MRLQDFNQGCQTLCSLFFPDRVFGECVEYVVPHHQHAPDHPNAPPYATPPRNRDRSVPYNPRPMKKILIIVIKMIKMISKIIMLNRYHNFQCYKQLRIYKWIIVLMLIANSSILCMAGYNEKRLLHDLLDSYNILERPVVNESDPLQLSFGLTLMQIIDVDEKNQLLVTNIWLKLEWNDMNLRWNTTEYGGVRDLRIPPHRIWKPDVLMYNRLLFTAFTTAVYPLKFISFHS